MKHALFNPIATRKEWRISAVALAFVLLAMFGLSSGVAQVKNQKRVTSVRLGSASEGSRVTVVSDSALNDYEAYRRGDRFYVKIPAADFASAVPNFRGTGFEDVQVQKAADSAVISFRLHPGTAARVDQRSNRLDVVFSTPGRSQNAVGTATRATGGAQNSSRGSTEIAAGSTSVATSTPGSLLAPVSPGQPLSSSAATTQGPASPQSVPASGAFLTRWVTRNWLAVLIAALLLGGLAFVFVRRRSSLTGNRRPKQSKEILVQPKNPSDVRLNEPDLFASVEHLTASPLVAVETSEPADLEPLPLAPPSSETTINPSSATPIPPAALEDGFAAEEARLRLQEEALIRAAEELERRRLETKALRKRAEEEAQLKAANEEPARAKAEARLRAEDAPRRKAEEEARVKAEIEMRTRAEEEARQRAEEDSRFRLEAETLRRAAEELARRRVAKLRPHGD